MDVKNLLIRFAMRGMGTILFLLALGFAIKNGAPVTIHYYLGLSWNAPLALALLMAFAAGAASGLLAALGGILRHKRTILDLKRELRARPSGSSLQTEEA